MAGINLMDRHMAIAASPHIENQNGSIISTKKALAMPVKKMLVSIEPVQSGSGDPSPTNVRPISGWTGAKVTRTGKNLLNVPDRSITYKSNTYTSSNGQIAIQQASNSATAIGLYSGNVSQYGPNTWDGSTFGGAVFVKAGQTFTLSISISSLSGTPVSGRYIFAYVYYADGTRANFSYITGTGLFTLTQTAPADVVEVSVWISNATSQVTAEFTVQLELGSTATTYEPYNGTTYDITFPTEAGTVYGGTLDVTTGLLTVTHEILELDGVTSGKKFHGKSSLTTADQYSLNKPDGWTFDAGRNRFVTDEEADAYGLRCSVGEYYSNWNGFGSKYCYTAYIECPRLQMRINFLKSMGVDTIEKANEWAAELYAAGTPCQFIYPLATPQTYQLTPTEVTLLLGENNVWADTGNITMKFWSH